MLAFSSILYEPGTLPVTLARIKQRPLKLGRAAKHDVRTQFGALPWRIGKNGLEILLVTGRKSRRWGIPKGWPVNGATPSESAAREAWEEAGAKGEIAEVSVGLYSYAKRAGRKGARLPCVVSVFPLHVTDTAETWPEAKARKRRWVSAAKAMTLVENPELSRILADFDPCALNRHAQRAPLNFPVF